MAVLWLSCALTCLMPVGTRFACKTIPKIPKRGKGTPRYLLKLQTEVDAMVQLGPSLDAVYLKVSLKGWPFCVRSSQGKGSISACQ